MSRAGSRPGGGGCLVFIFALAVACASRAQAQPRIQAAALTVYSPGGFALVEEVREVEVVAGHNQRELGAFPAALDPSTLRLGVQDAGVRSVGWRWEAALQGDEALDRALGERVRVDVVAGNELRSFEGVLLARQGGLLLRDDAGRVHQLPAYAHVEWAQPQAAGPRLVWEGSAERAGRARLQLGYEVSSLSWSAEYILTLNPAAQVNRGTMGLAGMARLHNQSGAHFAAARVLLVAGTVRRAAAPGAGFRIKRGLDSREAHMASSIEAPAPVGETYTYALSTPVDLPDRGTLFLPWREAREVPYEQEFVYRGQNSEWPLGAGVVLEREAGVEAPKHAEAMLHFVNKREHGLDGPLPAGRVRVGTRDQGRWVLLGEASLDHTPAGERVGLVLGEAFDIVGERRQVDYQLDAGQRRLEEAVEFVLRNRKALPVEVRVREKLYRAANWEITEASGRYEKRDARTIEFFLPIEPQKEKRVRYRVRYSW